MTSPASAASACAAPTILFLDGNHIAFAGIPQDSPTLRRDSGAPAGGATGGNTGAQQEAPPPNAGKQPSYGECFTQNLPMILAMVAIFYFMLIRPAQKQEKTRKAMMAALKRGDRVVTSAGLHGEVQSVDASTVTLRVNRDTDLVFDKGAIQRILGDDSAASSGAKTGGAG
ncbi:MAG: preprotein translocase subunit YajC [Planctomycetota bacterium]